MKLLNKLLNKVRTNIVAYSTRMELRLQNVGTSCEPRDKYHKYVMERRLLMPTTQPGREAIKTWMEETGIQQETLATAYGIKATWLSAILNGRDTSRKAHLIIMTIIQENKIKAKEV